MREAHSVMFVQFSDAARVAAAAANAIREAAEEALSDHGRFRILLAGGTSPLAAYRLLTGERLQWAGWEVYFGDERCLSPQDPRRNSHAAQAALLDRVPIPREQIHPIPAELGAEAAAQSYARELAPALPFDLTLLGMGEDGHTASLFPGHRIDDDRLVIPVHDAPKPPPDRVSLSLCALARCRQMLILVNGKGKRDAVQAWRAGAELPVARAARMAGARILIDAAAAGESDTRISQ